MTTPSPRCLWMLFEPVHAVTYFAPAARAAFESAGLRGFWRGYFAGRSAPLGAVDAAPVVALFYGFAPAMVERALPGVWQLAAPDAVLAARRAGARVALAALAGEAGVTSQAVAEAAGLLHEVIRGADTGGRVLGAANAALPWPDDPLEALWHGTTVLRELRGDGHVAALLTAGVSGLDALLLRAGSDLDRPVLQQARGWTDEEWAAAAARLQARGLLDAAERVTPAAGELLADVETVTDHLAAQPWQSVGSGTTSRFTELVRPLARAAAAALPELTPIGLPASRDH